MSESLKRRRKKREGRGIRQKKEKKKQWLECTTKNNMLDPVEKLPPQNVKCKCKYSCKISDLQKLLLVADFYKADFCQQQIYSKTSYF